MGSPPADTAASVVMSADEMRRALRRMAHEIVERDVDASELFLVGILTRGAYLADRLAESIRQFAGVEPEVGHLDVRPFRDDRDRRVAPWSDIPVLPIEGRTVVIADDVLYTGRTVRAALEALTGMGRAGSTQLAVFVDRGHREMPVRPDFVGKNLPTNHRQHVSVQFVEVDGIDSVRIGPR